MPKLDPHFPSAIRRVFAAAETMVKFPVENAIPLDRIIAGFGDAAAESLPPVALLRSSDLLNVTFRFVNLDLKTDGSPRLVRSKAASPAFLIAVFGPQHLLEQAFFDDAGGAMHQSPPTPTPSPLPAPQSLPAKSESMIYPVKAILAKSSRLVFRVGTEEIAYTEEGLITAMGQLPLSVVPHAESYSSLLSWDVVVTNLGALDHVSRAVAAATKTANRSKTTRGRAPKSHQQLTSDLHAADALTALSTYARTQRAAGQIDARFGAYSALAAVAPGVDIGNLLVPIYQPGREPPELREPSSTETAIELPWRLQLSPHSKGAFAHSADEVEHGGRVELWHTRLGTRVDATPTGAPGQQHPSVSETDPATRTVRAVWTREFDAPAWSPTARPLVFPEEDLGNPDTLAPFRASLSQRDRMMIVHETSNYHAPGMPPAWTPTPVSVNHLMLTALGGWLDSAVRFPIMGTQLTIEEWEHRATMGRDQYVKVVYSGLLHPFGHRASLVKVTERRVAADGKPATLYQRLFVVVRQPERTFGASGTAPQKNRMPFTWVRILTASTPPLALPHSLRTGVGQLFMPEIAGAASVGPGTEPFRFRVLVRDIDNHLIEFEGPMVFIEDSRFGNSDTAAALAAANQIQISYPLRGQRVAYAPPGDADDTTLATVSMQFDAELDAAGGGTDRNYILPVLKIAAAAVPALSAFTGQSDPVLLAYPDAYASNGFGGKGNNDGEVFLALINPDGTAATPVTMGFNSKADRSGGFVSPGVDVKALARRVGPVGGDLATLANDATSFDVGSMFKPDTAKLFGILPLAQLLPKSGGVLPKFVTEAVSSVTALQQAIVQAKSILAGQAAALTSQGAEVSAAAGALAQRATEFADAVAGLAASPPLIADFGPILTGIHAAAALLLGTLTAADQPLPLPRPVAEQLESLLRLLTEATGTASDIDELIGLITTFFDGGLVPEVVNARLAWETPLMNWPDDATKIFAPGGDTKLRLVSEIRASLKGGTPQALISCALPPFQLRLMGDTHFISINVAIMEFSVKPGHKPDVNVRLEGAGKGIVFAGPLGFVETLKQIIPFDGFSDPPYLDISTSGLRAGFDLAIPDLAMGIFALTNIHLGAELIVPFIGESLEFRFFFATRENPFRLQVAFFAGGGFFAITISPNGLKVIEASFEFGAAVAMSFVVASGSLSVMAGIYFRLEIDGATQKVQLTGYFRARGEVDVLGLISACIELYLELSYFNDGGNAKAIGKASISIEVSVCFLSFSVSVSCEKKFAGSAGDPTFLAMMGPYTDHCGRAQDPWLAYCQAFAVEAA